jgi:hypothetical protein
VRNRPHSTPTGGVRDGWIVVVDPHCGILRRNIRRRDILDVIKPERISLACGIDSDDKGSIGQLSVLAERPIVFLILEIGRRVTPSTKHSHVGSMPEVLFTGLLRFL